MHFNCNILKTNKILYILSNFSRYQILYPGVKTLNPSLLLVINYRALLKPTPKSLGRNDFFDLL